MKRKIANIEIKKDSTSKFAMTQKIASKATRTDDRENCKDILTVSSAGHVNGKFILM